MIIGTQKKTSCYKYVHSQVLFLNQIFQKYFYKLVINESLEHKEILEYFSEF